jgi:hypothetical protein
LRNHCGITAHAESLPIVAEPFRKQPAIVTKSTRDRCTIFAQSIRDRFANFTIDPLSLRTRSYCCKALRTISSRSLLYRFVIAALSLRNHYASALQSICNRFANSIHTRCAITARLLSNCFAFYLRFLRNRCESPRNRLKFGAQSIHDRFVIAAIAPS